MDYYNEYTFRTTINKALERIKQVLDINKSTHTKYVEDVPHTYVDKYLLAESLANSTIRAQVNCLEALGVNRKILAQLKVLSAHGSVSCY